MKLNWNVSAMRPVEIDQRLADAGYSLSLTDKSRYLYHMTDRLMRCGGWDSLAGSKAVNQPQMNGMETDGEDWIHRPDGAALRRHWDA